MVTGAMAKTTVGCIVGTLSQFSEEANNMLFALFKAKLQFPRKDVYWQNVAIYAL